MVLLSVGLPHDSWHALRVQVSKDVLSVRKAVSRVVDTTGMQLMVYCLVLLAGTAQLHSACT